MTQAYSIDKSLIDLDTELNKDFSYSSGKILSSMNGKAESAAREIFIQNLEKNLGDPTLFPGTQNIESQVIRILGQLFDLPHSGSGLILTGGSEANITALWAIRNNERLKMEKKESTSMELIAPVSAHVSINKAADLLGIKLVSIPVTSRYQIDLSQVRSAINSRTIGIVGVAGTTAFGTLDPLQELNEICLESNLPLHVDAAFGGLVFPFLPGSDEFNLSFNLKSLTSLTVDIHKMGRMPIPGGGLLWRDKSYKKEIKFTLPYLAGNPKQYTLTGTRLGASAIAFAHLWNSIGFEGFQQEVIRCLQNTQYLARELKKRGFNIPIKPLINILGVQLPVSTSLDKESFHQLLWGHGWTTSIVNGVLRFVIMPSTTRTHLNSLLKVIDRILKDY